MAWLKTVGCNCPECGPDPCTPGCFCEIAPNDSLQIAVDDHYDVSGCSPVDRELTVEVYSYSACAGPTPNYTYRIQIFADAVSIYDSGCTTGNISLVGVTMPAGTSDLNIVVTPFCTGSACESGGTGSWQVRIP